MKIQLEKTNLVALILGEAGSGKTWFASATKIKTFYVLTEKQGMETLRLAKIAGMIHPQSVFELIETWEDWERLITSSSFDNNIKNFDLFVLDTIDDLDERIGNAIATKMGLSSIDEIDDYGRSRATAKSRLQTHVLNVIRSLPIDVVVLCHIIEKEIIIDKQKTIKTALRISSKQEEVVSQKFNLICFLEKNEFNGRVKRQLLVRTKSDKLTKDHPAFLDKEEADLPGIIKKFKNYGNLPNPEANQEAKQEEPELKKR